MTHRWMQRSRTRAFAASILTVSTLAFLGGCANSQKSSDAADEASQSSAGTSNESPARYRSRLHTELGANYLQRGQYAIALEELREAVRVDPNYGLAHSIMGL
ncbi:MAG: hypothetical protein EAZ24_11320, partial [Burkholderiales bacterium]